MKDIENNQKTGKRLGGNTGKGFKPGQSGNPGGRPKIAPEWKDKCRTFMETSGGWERLSGIALDDGRDDQLKALTLIAAYAYGKPTEHKITEFGGDDALEIVIKRG